MSAYRGTVELGAPPATPTSGVAEQAVYALTASVSVYALGASAAGTAIAWPGLAAAIALNIAASVILLTWDVRAFATYWVLLCLTQNLVAGILASAQVDALPFAVTEQKTVSIAVAAMWSGNRVWKMFVQERLLLAAAAAYGLLLAARLTSPSVAALGYARNFLVGLLAIVVIGTGASALSYKDRVGYVRQLSRMVAALSLVGCLVESLVGSDTWHRLLNADKLANIVGISASTGLFGLKIDRVGGFVVQTTNAGYIAASCLVVMIVTWQHRDGLFNELCWAGVAFGALIMTAAKNGFILILIAIICLFVQRRSRLSRPWAAGTAWLASFAVVWIYIGLVKGFSVAIRGFASPLTIIGGDATTYHMAGLIAGITAGVGAPLGHGLGAGGNFGNLNITQFEDANSTSWIGSGGESSIGVLAYQLGIVGLALFALIVILLGQSASVAGWVVLTAWVGGLMFHEALLGPQAAAVLLLAAGFLLGADRESSGAPRADAYSLSTSERQVDVRREIH